MKRKIHAVAAVLVLSLFLTACGSKEYLKDIKTEKYVTLGNYMGIEASADMMEILDDVVDNYIEINFLEPKAETAPVTGRPVQDGDIANIDFVGYQDGVAFEGGTGSGFDLTIGSGQFIDGFEEGLIGVEIGETVSLDLAFPDPYTNNPDLAGQPVVFEVTVNSITERKLPELTDDLVKQLYDEGYNVGSCQTAAELWDWVYDIYYQTALSTYESQLEIALAQTIMEGCTFQEPPEEMAERFTQSIENTMSANAASAGMTLAQYMQLYEGLDEEGYRALFDEEGVRMAKQYIMYQAIADREGLMPAQEQISEKMSSLMTLYGYASEEELKKGVDVEAVEEDLMRENVVAFLKENGTIQATTITVD